MRRLLLQAATLTAGALTASALTASAPTASAPTSGAPAAQAGGVSEPSAQSAPSAPTVRIENAEGYSLEIGRLSASQALCTFRLPAGGQDALHAEKLPTFQVGAFPVQTVVAWPDAEEPAEDGGDFMEAARRAAGVAPLAGVSGQEVRFFCWQGLAGQASPTRGLLRQVMEGEELRVRFTLGDASTGETSLLLTGVRERVAATLGISENPTEADFLQDELLRLRVSYRSSTCYLLAGEKNRQRCLDDVNRCAQRPQESVIAMVGCIEVE